MSAIDIALDRDRGERKRERRIRVTLLLALAVLLPALLWAAAYGVAPIVRGAYALMAVGVTAMVIAELAYFEWSRQALPGPTDARTQLQKAAFVLARQVTLMSAAPLWSAPVFVGVALIGDGCTGSERTPRRSSCGRSSSQDGRRLQSARDSRVETERAEAADGTAARRLDLIVSRFGPCA